MPPNEVTTIIGAVEVHKIPVEVEVPVFKKKEMPEYVLVKEEIVYKVPKVLFETKTYERPVFKEKEYVVPVYVEKIYEVPKYIEKVYEVPVIKEVEKIIEIPKIQYREEIKIQERPYLVEVPKFVPKNIVVDNVIVTEKHVTNAIIKDITVEAVHPLYMCSKCKKEIADGS